ncbi:SDR family oxidoreductase [Microlunatus elymi]|uniref:SDR family oxidoreductase n=1 Tax=Microlunatus elymi TaxID=2596828 RepID=A0A516PVR6_9ACTN|nr:SDR family oxidoreductase [Microlunatus elymi]QDP95276.1 SDR family oxidoreductase [Microlunatus elymi]
MSLRGTVTVVTGGSTGIGRAVVEKLAVQGGAVVYCTHDQATLDAEADARWETVFGTVADVRSAHDMSRVMDEAVRRYGGLDGLVCCAGIQTYGTVEDTTEADWHYVLDTNLTGMFLAAKYAVPRLRERGGGAIVTISSVQGLTPAERVLGYSVSKAGIDALTRSMAVDHAVDRIRVNSVAPGPVDTPLVRAAGTPPTRPNPHPGQVPPGSPRARMASADEIADVVLFLLDGTSSYLTGATIRADGGMHVNQSDVLLVQP